MISLLRKTFIDNWPRKLIAFILAVVIWFAVAQSLTTTKAMNKVALRVKNIPPGMTIEGLQPNGTLTKNISFSMRGSRRVLEDLKPSDFEVEVDASSSSGEWIPRISHKNLVALDHRINLPKMIKEISHKNFILKTIPMVKAQVPVMIKQPVGESPKGYQFFDVTPYKLYITLEGPATTINRLKEQGIPLNFDLNAVTKEDLISIETKHRAGHQDIVSFRIPDMWKRVHVPELSEAPIVIDDPAATEMCIDFVRVELIPTSAPIPIVFHVLPKIFNKTKIGKLMLAENEVVKQQNGVKVLLDQVYAVNVSECFFDIVKDHLQIAIVTNTSKENTQLPWCIQILQMSELEDKYVDRVINEAYNQKLSDLHPQTKEEYIRNRFRCYVNRLKLFSSKEQPLELNILRKSNQIIVTKHEDSCTP